MIDYNKMSMPGLDNNILCKKNTMLAFCMLNQKKKKNPPPLNVSNANKIWHELILF